MKQTITDIIKPPENGIVVTWTNTEPVIKNNKISLETTDPQTGLIYPTK